MTVQYLERTAVAGGRPRLAYAYTDGAGPLVMFCGGYRSDMNGTKALYLEQQASARGQAFLRFDYSGHGQSGGDFENGMIGAWKDDALAVLAAVNGADRPVLLVGSSMGGWIALLLALAAPGNIAGLIGIAAAPDFTEDIYAHLSPAQKAELAAQGFVMVPNDYSDEPYKVTRAFYEEARAHLVLGQKRHFSFPVRLIQGGQDKDVLPETAYRLKDMLDNTDCRVILVADGDHRLSRPQDLELIDGEIRAICACT